MPRNPCLARKPRMTLLDKKWSKWHLNFALWNRFCYQLHKYKILYYKNYTLNTELNNHSLVQETGSRLTPYHRPCFARQPRSTSIPSIPLEIKSKPKRTLKKFVKRIISVLAHILVDVKRIFLWDSVSVYILFICVFWQYLSAKTAQF